MTAPDDARALEALERLPHDHLCPAAKAPGRRWSGGDWVAIRPGPCECAHATIRAALEARDSAEYWKAESERWKERARTLEQERDGEVWLWQGDGEDDLGSLTCPVLIRPDALRELLEARGEPWFLVVSNDDPNYIDIRHTSDRTLVDDLLRAYLVFPEHATDGDREMVSRTADVLRESDRVDEEDGFILLFRSEADLGAYVHERMTQAMEDAAFEARGEARWVSVDETLPADREWVWGLRSDGQQDRVCFVELFGDGLPAWYLPCGVAHHDERPITHWMPLPPPPGADG